MPCNYNGTGTAHFSSLGKKYIPLSSLFLDVKSLISITCLPFCLFLLGVVKLCNQSQGSPPHLCLPSLFWWLGVMTSRNCVDLFYTITSNFLAWNLFKWAIGEVFRSEYNIFKWTFPSLKSYPSGSFQMFWNILSIGVNVSFLVPLSKNYCYW